MKLKTCCFAGHSQISDPEQIKLKLKKEIINLMENHGVTQFYSGGKGAFDWLCAHSVNELRKDFSKIKSYLVLAYMPEKNDDYARRLLKIFDGTIYPDIEKTPKRFAILKRNEWMVNNSDFLIAYVEYGWGGAVKTLEYAEKKKHIIVNNIAVNRNI